MCARGGEWFERLCISHLILGLPAGISEVGSMGNRSSAFGFGVAFSGGPIQD